MEALEAVMGGHGGRLFSDLRDKRSLAYVVQPFYSPALHAGVFGVYMAVGPGKGKQALAGLAEHLQAIRRKAPTEAEVERARSYLIGGQAIGLQSNAALASVMALDQLRGLGYDNYKKAPGRIAAVTPDQILAAVKKYLQPHEKVELIQGR
jgi:zinc protease